ncbi:probable disease resistance protein At1g61300 [Cryptomeria japonica]|uniref:probable disease resistance protein At1g61300 n=1 Tax=Cryptomeria japonica TaxID=3369 RepID=UPI0027DA1181|nr:probable disease resistance protein At1g61300 [Cryptomeria japonica]
MDFLNALSGVAGEGVKKLFQEFKNLINLRSNAECLRQDIDRVKGIGDDLKNQLSGQGRQPKRVVRNWLDTQERNVKSAEEALQQYEQSKDRRFCKCCPNCLLIPKSSRKILNSLAEIDKLLKTKDSDFPKNGELGELPGALVQPMENELVGKFVHEKLEELETWLLKDDSVRVVGVYGMPGVGKTSMLKHINNNEKVVNFFKLVIWVTVSRDSDISDLQRRICERIELPWRSNSTIDEAAGLLQTVFKEKPLLLILDDVWKRIDVSKLGISLSDNKIKVVLTSRDKEVCRSMEADKMIAMKQLSEEDGWELFCRGAFPAGEDQNMDSEIEPLARSIAKECKGHPLAIKTLARTVPQLHNSSPSEWEYVLYQLKAIDTQFYRIHEEIVRELFKPLKHSYDALESEELRLCFLYLAAYREDEEIDADDLIQLWLAEGLVKSREEGRHGFLKTLANRCLVEVEVTEENGYHIWKVKIHDVLRDMAVHVAEVDQNILFRAGQSLTEFPKSASATSVRISVMHNRIRILPESVDCEKLVTLLLSWNTVEEVPEGFLEKLNMLKVLGLSNTPIKSLPKSIHQLKHLLYLQLSNTQIKVIPHQIFELSRLQFLDLSFSPLKNIPSMIKKLKSLQILKLAHCYDLEFVSCDISHLTSLEELDLWKSTMFGNSRDVRVGGESREASLQDVCKLHRLKHLRLILKSQIEEKTMGNLVELQELWLLWMPEVRQTYLPTDMRAMHSLERLHLYNCHVKGTPDLFPELKNLKYLKLKSSQILLTLSGIGLARLSNLNEIDIEECLLLTELGEDFGRKGCFPRLRKLKLWMLPSLESVCSFVEEGALPMLQTLTIFRCMQVKVLPPGLDNLNSLEQIKGEKEWWNEISWRNEEMKKHLHTRYVEIHDNYHV